MALHVTGISGYTGAHVASQPLREGYRVPVSVVRLPRSTLPPSNFKLVRPRKVRAVQERYAAYGDRIKIRPDNDLVDSGSHYRCFEGYIGVLDERRVS